MKMYKYIYIFHLLLDQNAAFDQVNRFAKTRVYLHYDKRFYIVEIKTGTFIFLIFPTQAC